MNRHDFVEQLIRERNEVSKRRFELLNEKFKAYNRSATRFKEMLIANPLKRTITGKLNRAGVFGASVSISTPENAKVTNDDIKALYEEISSLEKECGDIEAEISKYKSEDFVGAILEAGE